MSNIATRILVPHATIAGLSVPTDVTLSDVLRVSRDNLTALAGGAQAGTALTAGALHRFVTVATTADSAQLPASIAGTEVIVINAHASNAVAVFGQTGDAINAIAANSAFSVAAGKAAHFYCTAPGRWHSILTA